MLVLALLSVLLFAERHLEGGVLSFAGQAAALPGTEAEREASTKGLEHTEVFPLLMFAVGGMLMFPAANDLLTMFVALEVLSLPLYLLCGLARRRRLLSQEAAMKYFLLGAFSSGFFVYGIALVYGYAGSMGFAQIADAVAAQTGSEGLLLGGIALLAVGLLFKVGAAPFHAWTPDVYQGAPTAVTAFMAASTKVAAFGALLRLFYVAFGADRTDWMPMIWIVAILTMVVGSVLALTQTDIKRLLAYSSIAHAGFILTGFLGIRSLNEVAGGSLTGVSAVLFYLTTYGFATLAAFALVTVVRDAGGEATHLSRWQGLGKESPLVAGLFAFLLLAMAGIPLTSGFTGKWAVFAAALSAGAWPVVIVAVLMSAVAAYFYVRVIVLMFFAEPVGEGPERDQPERAHGTRHRRRCRHDPVAGPRPGRPDRSARPRGSIRQVNATPRPLDRAGRAPRRRRATRLLDARLRRGARMSALALPILDPDLEARLRTRMDEVEQALLEHVESEAGFVTQAARHLMEAGGKRFRPLLVLLAAETGDTDADGVLTSACVVELTHLASLYHDDVMDEADLRRGAESANARWDNHVAILTGDFLFSKSSELTADLGPEAVRIQAQTFTRLVEGQILETLGPTDGEDPLEHYLRVVAGKTGSLIATSARYGAMFAGAPRDVVEALTEYGEKVGVAFQLSDDILDIASETEVSGKTPGHRPPRGRADAAGADRPALHRPRRRPPARAARLRPDRRRSARRGTHPAARPPGDGRGPRLRRQPGRRGQGACSRCFPRARSGPPSRPSPTRSRPAPADQAFTSAPPEMPGSGPVASVLFPHCARTSGMRA